MKDLNAYLPLVVLWAKKHHDLIQEQGSELNEEGMELARSVGVAEPERIRVMLVDNIPFQEDPVVFSLAKSVGMLSGQVMGLTLGHALYIVKGYESTRLYSHEFRHIHQYEVLGSIGAFMEVYLEQVMKFGYHQAPLEQDARQFEAEC
jgi:hypothetical protein